jgi:hypothetical protein
MIRNPKIHWRYFKTFHETWKLNSDNGKRYAGNTGDPDIIQVAEALNGLLQVWKRLDNNRFVWFVSDYAWGECDSMQEASTKATKIYKGK